MDRIPDSLLLVIFNKIGDVKSLVPRQFHSLIPQVNSVVVGNGEVKGDAMDEGEGEEERRRGGVASINL